MKISLKLLLPLLIPVVLLNTFLVVSQNVPNSFIQIFSLFNSLFVPGFLVTLILHFRSKNSWQYIFHSLGISIGIIYALGFVASFLFPTMGILRPLDKLPFTYFQSIVTFVLIGIAIIRNWKTTIFVRLLGGMSLQLLGYICAIAVSIVSIAGAVTLNNGGTNALALSWFFLIALLLLISIIFNHSFFKELRPYLLLVVSLSVMWMLSARSSHLIGWDIIEELQVARTTMLGGKWSLKDIRDAYNACLSISILPTVLSNTTLLSVEALYKFLYPFLFAQFPLILYFWLKKIGGKDYSALAVLYIVAQPFFNQSMVGLARQEIAFFFFALLFLTIFTDIVKGKSKILLNLFYIAALVTSHYSTTYLSIILFLGPYSIILFLQILKRIPLPSFITKLQFYKNWVLNYTSSIKWWMVVFLFAFTYIWFFLFTKTGAGVGTMVANSVSGMTKLFQNEQKSQEVRNAIPGVSNVAITTDSDVVLYQHHYDTSLDNLTSDRALMIFSTYPSIPINDKQIEPSVNPAVAKKADIVLRYLKDGLKYVLLFGVFIQCIKTLRKTRQNLDHVLFSTVSASLLLVTIFHPTLGVNYNIARIYVQLLVFLSISLLIGMDTILWLVPSFIRKALIGIVMIIILGYLQGSFVPYIGGTPALQFYQSGTDFEKYYAYDGELFAGRWLQKKRDTNAVYADNFSGLRIRTVSGISANPAIVPTVLDNDRHSYVYESNTNKVLNKALVNFSSKFLTFSYPTKYLDTYRNLMYSNKNSNIYK